MKICLFIFGVLTLTSATPDFAKIRNERETGDNIGDSITDFFNGLGDTFSSAVTGAIEQLNTVDWAQLGEEIKNSEFVTNIINQFEQINWDEIKDNLFTAGDTISTHAVDAYEQARDAIREQVNCKSIENEEAKSLCDSANSDSTKFYNSMKATIDEIQREITAIESDPTASVERKRRAADLQDRIETLESQSLSSASTNTLGAIFLYLCLAMFV